MSILTALRVGVAAADKITKPLQPTVTYQRYLSDDDGYGSAVYATAVPLRAIVDWRQKQVRTKEGVLSVSRAIVTLLDVAEVAAATENQGIGDNDIFILPDGTTGPILDMAGFIDAGTGQPIATEVILG
jgi:hypothetical protein